MSIIGELILSRWNDEIDWHIDNGGKTDPAIKNNRDFIVIEITKQIEKYWGEHKNIKRPDEFDCVLWEYKEVGVEIEYQLYWDENYGDWYYSVVVYPLGIWDQPVLPDMEDCCELVISIDPGSIKSAIRDKKLEILGL